MFLQVTIAAIHRTVASEIDHEVITADLAVAAGTLFEKLAAMAHQIKLLLGRAEKIAVAEIGEGRRADVLDNFHRNLRQGPAQVLVDRARLRTGLDDQLCGEEFFHVFRYRLLLLWFFVDWLPG